MIRRSRRSLPATIVAIVILAVCVIIAVATLQQLTGHHPILPFASLARFGQHQHFNGTPMLLAAAIAAALGLILLACAWWPGKPTILPLTHHGDGEVDAGMSRTGFARALRTTATDVDGVTRAKIRVRRRRIKTKVRTERDDPTAVGNAVHGALERHLGHIGLARTPRIRVAVRRIRSKQAA